MRDVQYEAKTDGKSKQFSDAIDVLELLKDSEAQSKFMRSDGSAAEIGALEDIAKVLGKHPSEKTHLPDVTIDFKPQSRKGNHDWKSDLNKLSKAQGTLRIGSEKLTMHDGNLIKNGKVIGKAKDGGLIKLNDGRSIDLSTNKTGKTMLLEFTVPGGGKHKVLSAGNEQYDLSQGQKNIDAKTEGVTQRWNKYNNDGGSYRRALEAGRHILFNKTCDDMLKEVTDKFHVGGDLFRNMTKSMDKNELPEPKDAVDMIKQLKNVEGTVSTLDAAHQILTKACTGKLDDTKLVQKVALATATAALSLPATLVALGITAEGSGAIGGAALVSSAGTSMWMDTRDNFGFSDHMMNAGTNIGNELLLSKIPGGFIFKSGTGKAFASFASKQAKSIGKIASKMNAKSVEGFTHGIEETAKYFFGEGVSWLENNAPQVIRDASK